MNTFSPSELILNEDGSIYHLHLKPHHLAPTIITVGDPERVEKISKYFDTIEHKITKREFVTHSGTYKGKKISVISTGMGTDNIDIFMNEIDALVNIDFNTRKAKETKESLNIIRVGTSGALQADIPLDSFLVSQSAIGIDTLMCFYDYPQSEEENQITESLKKYLGLPFTPYYTKSSESLLNKVAHDMILGNTVTAPGFYAPQGRVLLAQAKDTSFKDKLNSFSVDGFRLTNLEMETAGYYSLGKLMGHQMLSLNAILANRANGEFSSSPKETVEKLIQTVLERV